MKKLSTILIIILSGGAAVAQTGEIKGRILDESTAYGIPSAQIKVTNEHGLTVSKPIKSDANGDYIIMHLAPGKYELMYSNKGYWTETISGLIVSADKATNINFSLKPELKTK